MVFLNYINELEYLEGRTNQRRHFGVNLQFIYDFMIL